MGSYVKRLDACLMVFDLTKEWTFKSLFKWIKQLSQHKDIPYVIVGNKKDLVQQREVSSEELQKLGRDNGVHVFETSAKTGENV